MGMFKDNIVNAFFVQTKKKENLSTQVERFSCANIYIVTKIKQGKRPVLFFY